MINLSLKELRLIAKSRNISDYKNKSKEDLTEALRELEPKPDTKPKALKITPKPEPKMEIKVNRKKLEKLRKDFDELRHKFSNKDEIKDIEKLFIMLKNTTFCIRNRGGKKKS